jgi:hypothetical protein
MWPYASPQLPTTTILPSACKLIPIAPNSRRLIPLIVTLPSPSKLRSRLPLGLYLANLNYFQKLVRPLQSYYLVDAAYALSVQPKSVRTIPSPSKLYQATLSVITKDKKISFSTACRTTLPSGWIVRSSVTLINQYLLWLFRLVKASIGLPSHDLLYDEMRGIIVSNIIVRHRL